MGNVFAVGQFVFHFHDGEWTTYELPDGASRLTGVWGADLDSLFAVGLYGTILKYTCAE